MRFAALILLLALASLRADEPAWSPAEHGLQARLFTAPHTKDADYTYDVWIEFRNVGSNNLGLSQQIKIVFGLLRMNFIVTDSAGHEFARNVFQPMRLIPSYPLIIPPSGQISFPIGAGGGVTGMIGPLGRLLSFDMLYQWSLPFQGGPYHLAATYSTEPLQPKQVDGLTIVVPQNGHRVDDPLMRNAWLGTLELPAIALP